jgi:ribosomal-protein-serine acetyltransferase
VAESTEHLRPWMAWIADEPLALERRRAMIAEWDRDWSQGGDIVMGVFAEDGRIAGGCGLCESPGDLGIEWRWRMANGGWREGPDPAPARFATAAGRTRDARP